MSLAYAACGRSNLRGVGGGGGSGGGSNFGSGHSSQWQWIVSDPRPRSDFRPKRKTVKSYQSLVLRFLIIFTITLPVLIRMCLTPPYTATTQVLLITITATISTLMLGFVFFVVTKQVSERNRRRRHAFVSRRQSAGAARRTSQRIFALQHQNATPTDLAICTVPLNVASTPMRASNIPESLSSQSELSSAGSLDVMRVILPEDDPPSYYDVVIFNNESLPEVHRNGVSQDRSETPPPTYNQVVGSYL